MIVSPKRVSLKIAKSQKMVGKKLWLYNTTVNSLKFALLKPMEREQEPHNLVSCVAYTVKVLTNWGNSERVSCSFLQFLDNKRILLKPFRVASNPQIPDKTLSLLSGEIIKSAADSFQTEFPPKEEKYLSIIYFFPRSDVPEYVRLWNPTNCDGASVKDISVSVGDKEVYKGEIPEGYGVDIKLYKETRLRVAAEPSLEVISQLFPDATNLNNPRDEFGLYPIPRVSRITIEILDNYGADGVFGFNSLSFETDKDHKVDWDMIENVEIQHCSSFANTALLFHENEEIFDDQLMFMAYTNWEQSPTITFDFKKPQFITRVNVINFNGVLNGSNCGVKNVKFIVKKEPFWIGKIPKAAVESLKGQKVLKAKTKTIWLTDPYDLNFE